MVLDQKILLPDEVENILFSNEKRTARKSYKKSVKELVENMDKYFLDLEKN
jgi:hypothetical protein